VSDNVKQLTIAINNCKTINNHSFKHTILLPATETAY